MFIQMLLYSIIHPSLKDKYGDILFFLFLCAKELHCCQLYAVAHLPSLHIVGFGLSFVDSNTNIEYPQPTVTVTSQLPDWGDLLL